MKVEMKLLLTWSWALTGLITVFVSPLHGRCHWGLAQCNMSHGYTTAHTYLFWICERSGHVLRAYLLIYCRHSTAICMCQKKNKHISCVLHDGVVWLFLHTADGKQMFLRHHCGWQSTADLPATVSYLQSIYIYSMFALESPTLLKTTGWHVLLKINMSKALWRVIVAVCHSGY